MQSEARQDDLMLAGECQHTGPIAFSSPIDDHSAHANPSRLRDHGGLTLLKSRYLEVVVGIVKTQSVGNWRLQPARLGSVRRCGLFHLLRRKGSNLLLKSAQAAAAIRTQMLCDASFRQERKVMCYD